MNRKGRREEGNKRQNQEEISAFARVHESVLYDHGYKIPANSTSSKLFLRGPKTDKNIVAKVLLIRARGGRGAKDG